MPESEQKERLPLRSIPKEYYAHLRCLHCGVVESCNASTPLESDARNFINSIFDHVAKTGHRVEIILTESFILERLR